MSDTKVRLVIPAGIPSGAKIPGIYEEWARMSRDRSQRLLGNCDFAESAEKFAARATSKDRASESIIAVKDPQGMSVADLRRFKTDELDVAADVGRGQALGRLLVEMPLNDNRDVGDITVDVCDDAPDGLGELLLEIGIRRLRAKGRRTMWMWTEHPRWSPPESCETVEATATVPGRGSTVSPVMTDLSKLAVEHGFRPGLVEWATVLDVADAIESEPEEVDGYELLTFRSPATPVEFRDELARLYALASTDMPAGELSMEPEIWDGQRVARKEKLAESSGQEWIITVVRPVGGELVGWTHIRPSSVEPRSAWQEGTLVREDHRGRGLASWMKRVNLRALRRDFPAVERIYTLTEGENRAVIAMNRRLGFRPRLLTVGWQRREET